MGNVCRKCKKEYASESFALDGGYCKICSNGSKETASIFNQAFLLCVISGFFLCMLLDGGVISNPASFFYPLVILYFILRKIHFWISRHPKLTKIQKIGLSLFPIYSFPIFYILWLSIRGIFFNE